MSVIDELDLDPTDVRTGRYYTTYVVGNVSVAELDDHRIFEEEAEDIAADFLAKLREHPEVDATVDVVRMDRAVGDLLLDTVEEAARDAREYGLEKYGVVSADVTKYAVKSRVDVEGLETFVGEDPEAALAWAME